MGNISLRVFKMCEGSRFHLVLDFFKSRDHVVRQSIIYLLVRGDNFLTEIRKEYPIRDHT